jgi:hypothetical protein
MERQYRRELWGYGFYKQIFFKQGGRPVFPLIKTKRVIWLINGNLAITDKNNN